mgnify:CR=1 FL=1
MRILGNPLNLGSITESRKELRLSAAERATHLYVCGSTGTGKSKFLENLIRQDIKNWNVGRCGMLLIDPHGSLYDAVLKWIAYYDLKRPLVLINLSDPDWVIGYNVLRRRKGLDDDSVLVKAFIQAMAHVWGESGTNNTPLFAKWADTIFRTLYHSNSTLVESEFLIDKSDPAILHKLTKHVKARAIVNDWNFSQQLNPREYHKEISSTANRLRRFLANKKLRYMFGQETKSLDFEKALDEGAIVLVNTSTQENVVGEEDAALFSTLLLSDLWVAARARGKDNKNKPFYVYLDEFQKFVTPTMAENLDEARGYGLHLTLSHQFPNQLLHAGDAGKQVFDSVMENARSKVVFEVGVTNLEQLAKALFLGTFNPDEIKNEMYSTKVMAYREELRRSYTYGTTQAHGYGSNDREARNYADGDSTDVIGRAESTGTTDFYSDSESESISESMALIPEMGRELSHIQFRSLEEQLHRAMAVLFEQRQRECVVRLNGMRAPACIRVPEVRDMPVTKERVEKYKTKVLQESSVAMPTRTAKRQLEFRDFIMARKEEPKSEDEPVTAKRRIK